MANCVICSAELKFMNTPAFGGGKLSDGGAVCNSCFQKINKIGMTNLKKETTESLQQYLANPESVPKKSKKGCIAVSIFLVVVIGFIVTMTVLFDDGPKYDSYDDLKATFQVLSGDLIKLQLKYPDEGWKYDTKVITRNDSTLYTLQAVVIAKNAFGVKTRVYCTIKMRFTGTKEQSYKDDMNRNLWHIVSNDMRED
jgi:hypothetical protein